MKVRQCPVAILLLKTIICIAFIHGCTSEAKIEDKAYTEEIKAWRQARVDRLRGPQSWLSLVGRYPIQPGVNSIGSLDTNDIRFPGGPKRAIGTVRLDTLGLKLYPAPGITFLKDDGAAFENGLVDMTTPPMLHVESLYLTFLERAGSYYLRLWDTLNPARQSISELPAYPPDPEWKLKVSFTPADSGATIMLDDIQGQKRENALIGSITGQWRDTAFTLLALDGGPDDLFIIIEDATTDVETYPGGRYLDIPRADSTGYTIIDFNKAYIPPCAFTEFATCLLPPEENRLPFAVRAGEKTHEHE